MHICVRKNRDSLDGKLPQGTNHAASDFATVGNKDLLKHGELFSGLKRKLRLLLLSRESKSRSFRLCLPQGSIPNQQTNRCRIVSVTRVIQLRTIRNQADD